MEASEPSPEFVVPFDTVVPSQCQHPNNTIWIGVIVIQFIVRATVIRATDGVVVIQIIVGVVTARAIIGVVAT